MAVSHELYRHFDREGRLLYVGITNNPPARLANHRKNPENPWWEALAEGGWTTYQRFASREELRAAERTAIKKERPLWNVQHNERRHKAAVQTLPAAPVWVETPAKQQRRVTYPLTTGKIIHELGFLGTNMLPEERRRLARERAVAMTPQQRGDIAERHEPCCGRSPRTRNPSDDPIYQRAKMQEIWDATTEYLKTHDVAVPLPGL